MNIIPWDSQNFEKSGKVGFYIILKISETKNT